MAHLGNESGTQQVLIRDRQISYPLRIYSPMGGVQTGENRIEYRYTKQHGTILNVFWVALNQY